MFKIDEKKFIHVNRGDTMQINFNQKDEGSTFYAGDIINFNIMPKGNANEIKLQKTYTIEEESPSYQIVITSEDTKSLCEPFKSGTKTFWYEIELVSGDLVNTIVGYDEAGAKEFILYPEATDFESSI